MMMQPEGRKYGIHRFHVLNLQTDAGELWLIPAGKIFGLRRE
jgi:hypothetical protein